MSSLSGDASDCTKQNTTVGLLSGLGSSIVLSALAMALSCQLAFAQGAAVNSPDSPVGPYKIFAYPWENNDLGITEEVPDPWTPLRYRQNVIGCWGRDYSFAESILPEQITSQGQPIFARPPEISLVIDGKNPLASAKPKPAFRQNKENRAQYSITHTDGSARIDATGTLDYDGFLRIDIIVRPQRAVKLNELVLNLPLRKDVALFYSRYIGYDFMKQMLDREDFLESFGRIQRSLQMKFNPALWVGNHDIGIEWACETNQGWSPESPGRAIQLLPDRDAVVMRIEVVSKPLTIDQPYSLSFALYPTPVKALPADWRNCSLVTNALKPAAISSATHKIYGIAWQGKFPLRYQGLPAVEPGDSPRLELRDDRRPAEEKIREGRRKMVDEGIKFIPYGALYGMPPQLPLGEWKDYTAFWSVYGEGGKAGGDFLTRPQKGPRQGKMKASYICLYPKSFRDFFVWQYVQAIEKYGIEGLYLDLASPNILCRNRNHPHGKFVELGGEYYPFFWQRELMQRLYVACKSRKRDFLISVHHAKVPVVCSGFCDLVLSGEPLNIIFRKKPRVLDIANSDPLAYVPDYSELPNEIYEVQYSQRKGFISMLLPEIVKWNETLMDARPDLLKNYTRKLLARAVLYDIPLSAKRMDMDYYNRVLKAQERFGWLTGASYLGPWESGAYLGSGGVNLKAAFYLKPQDKKLMLVVSNLSDQDVREDISLNVEALSKSGLIITPDCRVLDAMEGAPYPSGQGRITVTVPPQDFRVFIVQ